MADVVLKHVAHEVDATLYFYDGQAGVTGGVVRIPASRDDWAARAWHFGYRLNVETGQALSYEELIAVCSAKSAETTDAGPSVGRQPTSDNGLRSSKP